MGGIIFIDNSITKQHGKSDIFKGSLPNSKVFVASTSEEGMRLALEADPEVIIIGGLNQRVECFDLCRQIKQHEKLQDIPVIFVVTEHDTRETREKASEAGADVFLSYPFDDIELRALIKTTMRLRTASRKPLKEQSILSETENICQNMVRHFPQKIFIKDLHSVYLACNENYARDLGITPEEIAGKNDFHFHPEELARKYQQNDREVIDSGETKIIEEPYQFNGQYFWARTSKVPYRNNAGEIMGVLGIFEDITKQKKLEEELRSANERFAKIFDISPIAVSIFEISNEHRFVDCNDAFFKQTGYSRDEIIGKNAIELNLYSNPEEGRIIRNKFKNEGKVYAVEHHYRQKNGNINIGLLSVETFELDGRKYAIGANLDISELKQKESELIRYKENLEQLVTERTEALQKEIDQRIETEKILAESESKYRNLVDYSTSIVLEWNPDGNLLFLNKYGLDFFGYKPEEILGQSVLGKIVESTESSGFDMTEMMHLLKADPEKFTSRENENICKDGRKVWIAWTNKGIYDRKGKLQKILSVGIDRTCQREMEKELEDYHLHLQKMVDQRTEELTATNLKLFESESKFRAMSESSLTGIYIIEDHLIKYVNPAICRMYGYEPDEVLGKDATVFIHPDDRQMVAEYLFNRISENSTSAKYEFRGVKKNGEIIHVLALGGIANIEGKYALIGNVLDVTENKLNVERLEKSKRLYAVISQVNQAIVHLKDKEMLFQEICKIAIEFGKFRMAWIGLLDETTRLVKPQSIAGIEDGYLSAIRQIKANDSPEGRGPTGRCIIEGKYAVCNDFANDPDLAIWRDEALKRNYHSAIAIPIKQNGRTIGSFTLYATSTDYFDQEEIQLLTEVADDISFALDNMELERQHRQSTINLANSEQKFRDIFEHMPSGYILFELICDQNGNPIDHRLIEANAEFDKQTGLNRNEQIGRTSKELSWYWPEDVTQRYYQVAITGKSFAYERYNDSLNRYYEIRVSSPHPGQFALLFNDKTEQRKSELALQQSEAQLKGIFNNLQDVYIQSDSAGIIAVLSPSAVQFYGYDSMEELIGMPAINLYAWQEDRDALLKALRSDGKVSDFVCQAKRKDGTTFWVSLNIHHKYDSNGQNIGLEGIVRNITERKQAEEEIRLSRQHFQTMFEEAPLGIAMVDSHTGKILEVNLKFAQITGRSQKELMSVDWMSITHPEDLQIGLHQMSQLKAREISGFKYRKRYIKPNGEVVWVSITIAAIHSSGNQTLRHLAMIEDITELKAKEESVLILSRAVEQSKVSVVITDPSGAIEYVNPKFSQITGYSREEAIGQNPRILKAGIISYEREYYKELWDTIISGKDWQGEFINRKKNGEIYYELASISPVTDENGRISHFVAIKEDITERKKATEQIKTLSAVVEQSPLFILITDARHRITYANSQFTSFTQFSLEEIKGKIPWIFNPKHWDKETYNRMWDVLELGKVWQIDSTNRKKDGTPFWEHVTVYPLRDEKDTIINYIIIKEDITEKKQLLDDLIVAKEKAEENQIILLSQKEAIELSNERLESLLRVSQYQADSVQKILDFALEEAIQLTGSEIGYIYFYDEQEQEFRLNTWSKSVMKECEVQLPQTRYDLDTTGCWGDAVRYRQPVIINDYHSNHPSAKGLPEGHVQLQKFLTIPIIIDQKIVAVVGVANKKTEYDSVDVRQLTLLMDSVWKITDRITLIENLTKAKEEAEISEQKLKLAQIDLIRSENLLKDVQTISKTGGWEYDVKTQQMFWTPELFRIHEIIPDPNIDHVKVSAECYLPEDREKILDAFNLCVEKGIGYDLELLFTTYKGNKKWIRTKTEPIFEDGRIIKVIGSLIDITDQKIIENELLRAKEKAEESDRLKTAFLFNVSHEIRTPMNGILGFMELLSAPGLEEKERSNFISIINKSGERLMNTINDIVEISKIEIGDIQVNYERIDLEELMQYYYNFFVIQTMEKGLEFEITRQVAGYRANFVTDKVKLDGIMINLIKNAIKFTDKGKIEIGNYIKDGFLWLYVSDTGRGIPENKKEIIFNRFMQVDLALTRGYEGLGLGLSIVKSYIQALNGTIEVISTEGKGTTFLVSIPYHQAKESDDDMPEILSSDAEIQKPLVLVAEDDEVNFFFIKEVLSKEFRIIHARNGEQAVQLFSGNPDISIVLMDIKMPGEYNGLEAVRKIREINKKIPIIAQTAYAAESDRLMTREAGCTHFIAKPFSGKNLLSLIKNVLDL